MPNSQWKIIDAIYSLLILVGLNLLISIFIYIFNFNPSKILLRGIGFIPYLVAIFPLGKKYPLYAYSNLNAPEIVKYFVIGSIVCLVVNFPYGIWAGTANNLPAEYYLFINSEFFEKILYLIYLLVLFPIIEEVYFRGFLYRILRHRMDFVWAALISTIVFTSFHGAAKEDVIGIAVPGIVFAFVYERTDSILTSILTHSLNNTAWFIFTYLAFRG